MLVIGIAMSNPGLKYFPSYDVAREFLTNRIANLSVISGLGIAVIGISLNLLPFPDQFAKKLLMKTMFLPGVFSAFSILLVMLIFQLILPSTKQLSEFNSLFAGLTFSSTVFFGLAITLAALNLGQILTFTNTKLLKNLYSRALLREAKPILFHHTREEVSGYLLSSTLRRLGVSARNQYYNARFFARNANGDIDIDELANQDKLYLKDLNILSIEIWLGNRPGLATNVSIIPHCHIDKELAGDELILCDDVDLDAHDYRLAVKRCKSAVKLSNVKRKEPSNELRESFDQEYDDAIMEKDTLKVLRFLDIYEAIEEFGIENTVNYGTIEDN